MSTSAIRAGTGSLLPSSPTSNRVLAPLGAQSGVANLSEEKLIDLGAQKRKFLEGLRRVRRGRAPPRGRAPGCVARRADAARPVFNGAVPRRVGPGGAQRRRTRVNQNIENLRLELSSKIFDQGFHWRIMFLGKSINGTTDIVSSLYRSLKNLGHHVRAEVGHLRGDLPGQPQRADLVLDGDFENVELSFSTLDPGSAQSRSVSRLRPSSAFRSITTNGWCSSMRARRA